jgi:UDP-glucose 4-epimerase
VAINKKKKTLNNKKSILITGASGFIGSCLVEKAIEKGYQTFAVIRKNSNKQYLQNPAVNFVEFDFNNAPSLDKALQDFKAQFGKIDYIIHAAGVTKSINKQDFYNGNYHSTKNLVEALERNGVLPDKFVLVSSLAAFGCGETDEPITKHQAQKPLTEYGKSKMQAENYLRSKSNFPFVIVNPTAVYGPRDKDFFFLLKSISQGIEMYINNTKQKLSFVYVQDLVDAIYIAMESPAFNENFIVSDLENYTSKEFNNLVKKHLNAKTLTLVIPAPIAYFFAIITEGIGRITKKTPLLNRERLKEFKAKNWSVDATEIHQLGYKPNYKLDKGLQNAISWYKENGWLK